MRRKNYPDLIMQNDKETLIKRLSVLSLTDNIQRALAFGCYTDIKLDLNSLVRDGILFNKYDENSTTDVSYKLNVQYQTVDIEYEEIKYFSDETDSQGSVFKLCDTDIKKPVKYTIVKNVSEIEKYIIDGEYI